MVTQRRTAAGQAGYNLVMLIVLVAVLSVLVAAALPAWSTAIQREKEEELIFRGLQYAEAIRVFQQRFGRPPVRLEELIEVEPRSIRRLWEDPITGKAEWGLVFAGQQQGPQGGQGAGEDAQGRELGGGSGPQGVIVPGVTSGGDQVTSGPIVGVYSLADGDAVKTFMGKTEYSDWHFTIEVLDLRPVAPGTAPGQPAGQGGAAGGFPAGPPDLSARWTGRPWPPELEIQLAPGGGLAPTGPGVIGMGGDAGQQQQPRQRPAPPGGEPVPDR